MLRSMTPALERRACARIDKLFRVLVFSEEFGEQWFMARNISETGMFVEMPEPLPLHATLDLIARPSGAGLRFLRFMPEIGGPVPHDRLH